MKNHYFVSAYATSPSFYEWDPFEEKKYFQELANNPKVIGIEHPYFVNSEKYPLSWLREAIPEHWSMIITILPALMQESKVNPYFGLASMSEKDRILAVALVKEMNEYIHLLNEMFGKNVVTAVHLHSSPKNDDKVIRGNKCSLKRSLDEISAMNWNNIQLNLEHCDAYVPGQIPDKGFLSLEEEIEVIGETVDYGLVLNWARSAIECRSSEGPLKHIQLAMKNNLLKGFFFSGCTNNIESKYGSWKDTHMPPKKIIKGLYLEEDSLLGYQEIRKTLEWLNKNIYFGIKVLNPEKKHCIKKSVGLNIETIEAIEKVIVDLNVS